MKECIEIKNFTKQYNDFVAVEKLNLSIPKGIIFGLLGPNGAGKTTTIKAMTGRLIFKEGSISVLGHDVQKSPKLIHQKIGVVSEAQNLYENLTVFENIELFRELYDVPKERTGEIIETLSLQHKREAKVSSLSKGLKQRVLLARSILHSPELLFLDEPTSGIDPSSAQEVHEFILDIKAKGTTVFLTTHNMEEADHLCDEVAFINNGKIIGHNTPGVLKGQYGTSDIEVIYLDSGLEKTKLFSLDNSSTFSEIEKIRNEFKILSIHTKEASMKDVFLAIANSDNTGEK